MKVPNRDILRLTDISTSISTIQDYVYNVDFDHFNKNEMMQSASIRHLEIIGEASSKLSAEVKTRHGEVPWREIVALRNIVIHEYSRVDIAEVWTTIQQDLPLLKEQIEIILEELKNEI
jgi:uncharacterized protein with HEPN domain